MSLNILHSVFTIKKTKTKLYSILFYYTLYYNLYFTIFNIVTLINIIHTLYHTWLIVCFYIFLSPSEKKGRRAEEYSERR